MSQHEKDPKQISSQRKTLYYAGNAITIVGVLLFLSVFFSGFRFMSTEGMAVFGGPPTFILRGIIGFILIIIGQVLANIGKKGLAGSGVLLDPEQAREDLNPYTHMAGGMVKDAVEGFREAGGKSQDAAIQIKIRCRSCQTLNPEEATYCNHCGERL